MYLGLKKKKGKKRVVGEVKSNSKKKWHRVKIHQFSISKCFVSRAVIVSDFYYTIIAIKRIKDNNIFKISVENLKEKKNAISQIHVKLCLFCALSLFLANEIL